MPEINNNMMIITGDFLSTRWQVKTLYTNNKVDNYIITALELAKFINKERRVTRRMKRRTRKELSEKAIYPMSSWLFDLTLKKCEEYIASFKMKGAKMMQVNIKIIN